MRKRSVVDPLLNWIHEGSTGEWSFHHPSDAQRESIVFLIGSFLAIFILWKGQLPYWVTTKKVKGKVKREWKCIPIPILWPFKILTVLYHEISHAIVGKLSIWCKIWWKKYGYHNKDKKKKENKEKKDEEEKGAKILYIMVDKYEGGSTCFSEDGVPPSMILTLPAGYLGSCLFGCWFLFTGCRSLPPVRSLNLMPTFTVDAKWSKYGAISLLILTFISFLVCARVRPKSITKQVWHRICAWYYRHVKQDADAADNMMKDHKKLKRGEEGQRKQKDDNDEYMPTDHEQHTSLEIIMGCFLLVLVILVLAWIWDDSIYLRFVMLFMGLLSSLYAVWDIVLDGIKYGKSADSDVTLMAKEFEARKIEARKIEAQTENDEEVCPDRLPLLTHAGKPNAMLCNQLAAEQAIESREFMPALFHYGPADLLDDAHHLKNSVSDWVGDASTTDAATAAVRTSTTV
nr:hypothetical protein L203_00381 [Cryptococcus depauperatus CBS 7841]